MGRAQLTTAAMILVVAACSKDKPKPEQATDQTNAKDAAKAVGGFVGGLMKMAERQESLDKANPYASLHDPCILVSREEVEKYLGKLRAEPYREQSDCVYDATSGRSIKIDVDYTGGQMAMKMMKSVGGLTNLALADESGKADTLDGIWDEVRWQYGTLQARKGDVLVGVDVQASNAGPVGAADLANIALKRLGSPLKYDGDAAAEHKPGPLVAARDPCSLITKEEAAAILGAIEGAPQSDRGGCTFQVPSPLGHGTMPVELAVDWSGGFAKFGSAKMVNGMFNKSFLDPTMAQAGMEQGEEKMKQDSAGRADLEKMRGMMSAIGGPAMEKGSLRFKNDTAVAGGPWEEAAVLNGMTFAAVKKDVYVAMNLQMLGEAKAKALVAKAMGRI
jgi:hypothetical protein